MRTPSYQSLKNVFAQLADDMEMVTLTGVSTLTPSLKEELSKAKNNLERSGLLGEAVAREGGPLRQPWYPARPRASTAAVDNHHRIGLPMA